MVAPNVPKASVERLHEVLRYDPMTGLFTWKVRMSTGRTDGDRAGALKSDGYIRIQIDKSSYSAHRVAWAMMTGAWPTERVDHRNGLHADNRWVNLREATCRQNNENRKPNGVTGVKGVIWFKGKWQAAIKADRKSIYLGRFDTLIDAAAARLRAERTLFTHHREVC